MRSPKTFRCLKCAHKWQRTEPPDATNGDGSCPDCEHLYNVWANFNQWRKDYNGRQTDPLRVI